jgi:hypothetical protein
MRQSEKPRRPRGILRICGLDLLWTERIAKKRGNYENEMGDDCSGDAAFDGGLPKISE